MVYTCAKEPDFAMRRRLWKPPRGESNKQGSHRGEALVCVTCTCPPLCSLEFFLLIEALHSSAAVNNPNAGVDATVGRPRRARSSKIPEGNNTCFLSEKAVKVVEKHLLLCVR